MNNLPISSSRNVVFAAITFGCFILIVFITTQTGHVDYKRVGEMVKSFTRERQEQEVNLRNLDPSSNIQSESGRSSDNGKEQSELNALRANSVAYGLSDVDIDNMTDSQVDLTFHSYLDNSDVVCKRRLRMGSIGDGGWEICDDAEVRPVPECLIYSFGIHNEWSFDDDASRLYRCHVFSFDPSMKIGQHDRSDLVHFYPWGIEAQSGQNDKGWQMYTLADIRQKLGHSSRPLDVLKMDIEHCEWTTLVNLLETEQLTSVKQLLLEFHTAWIPSADRSKLKTIQALERAGFRKFTCHKNVHCPKRVRGYPVIRTSCYEVHYIKV